MYPRTKYRNLEVKGALGRTSGSVPLPFGTQPLCPTQWCFWLFFLVKVALVRTEILRSSNGSLVQQLWSDGPKSDKKWNVIVLGHLRQNQMETSDILVVWRSLRQDHSVEILCYNRMNGQGNSRSRIYWRLVSLFLWPTVPWVQWVRYVYDPSGQRQN